MSRKKSKKRFCMESDTHMSCRDDKEDELSFSRFFFRQKNYFHFPNQANKTPKPTMKREIQFKYMYMQRRIHTRRSFVEKIDSSLHVSLHRRFHHLLLLRCSLFPSAELRRRLLNMEQKNCYFCTEHCRSVSLFCISNSLA